MTEEQRAEWEDDFILAADADHDAEVRRPLEAEIKRLEDLISCSWD